MNPSLGYEGKKRKYSTVEANAESGLTKSHLITLTTSKKHIFT